MPVGELLQLFAGDLDACSGVHVQQQVSAFAYGAGYGLFLAVSCAVVLPYAIPLVLLLGVALGWLLLRSRDASEAINQNSDRQAELFRGFTELLYGLPTVRAYRSDPMLHERFEGKLQADTMAVSSSHGASFSQAMQVNGTLHPTTLQAHGTPPPCQPMGPQPSQPMALDPASLPPPH